MALKGLQKCQAIIRTRVITIDNDVNPEIRFLGEDYINRTDYTGYGLPPKIIFLKRDHGWSTTKFKN